MVSSLILNTLDYGRKHRDWDLNLVQHTRSFFLTSKSAPNPPLLLFYRSRVRTTQSLETLTAELHHKGKKKNQNKMAVTEQGQKTRQRFHRLSLFRRKERNLHGRMSSFVKSLRSRLQTRRLNLLFFSPS